MVFENIKCIVVGDGTIGKTTFINKFCSGKFTDDYIPTIIDSYRKGIMDNNGNTINLSFIDMAGQDDFKELRQQNYNDDIDIILVAFAINNRKSFDHVKNNWLSEVKYNIYTADLPIIIIGTKSDVRKDTLNCFISKESGESLAKSINAPYMECSSLTGIGIKEIINKITEIVLKRRANEINNQSPFGCILL